MLCFTVTHNPLLSHTLIRNLMTSLSSECLLVQALMVLISDLSIYISVWVVDIELHEPLWSLLASRSEWWLGGLSILTTCVTFILFQL